MALVKKKDQKPNKALTTEEQIHELKKKELEIERLKNDMALKYEREKTAKTEELMKKEFDDRLDYINKQCEKRIALANEEHKKELLLLMQNQNRQMAKLQEDQERTKQLLASEYDDRLKQMKELMNERAKLLEAKLIEMQKECTEQVIAARKSAFAEAEQQYAKQKELLYKEMKEERGRILKEIIDKLADEHMTQLKELKQQLQAKDERRRQLELGAHLLEQENEKLKRAVADLSLKTTQLAPAQVDASLQTEGPQPQLEIPSPSMPPTQHPKVTPASLRVETCVLALSLAMPDCGGLKESEIAAERKKKLAVHEMMQSVKVQRLSQVAKEAIALLNGKLRATTLRYANLCRSVQELSQWQC